MHFTSRILSVHNARQNIRLKGLAVSKLEIGFRARRTCFFGRMLELHYAVRIIFASARSTITCLAYGRPQENRRIPDAT